jgi:hypothetical protein
LVYCRKKLWKKSHYLVNDSLILKRGDFGGEDVFSPAGSNILQQEKTLCSTLIASWAILLIL